MPYFGTLYSKKELWAIIAYLRSFALELPTDWGAQASVSS